jgi:hypothetical protein
MRAFGPRNLTAAGTADRGARARQARIEILAGC